MKCTKKHKFLIEAAKTLEKPKNKNTENQQ